MASMSWIIASVIQVSTFILLVWWVAIVKMSNTIMAFIFGADYKKSCFGKSLRSVDFYLDPNVVCINNGSFGAIPKMVKDAQQKFRDEMERCPDDFKFYKEEGYIMNSVAKVAEFVNSDPKNIVFVPNATSGINTVLRSLDLKEGDAILVTNYTYGAIHLTAREVCHARKANLVVLNQTFQTADEEGTSDYYIVDIVDQYRQVLKENPNIRLAIIDHISSSIAVMLPIKKLIRLCREHGVMALIDGAHAPGQVPLELDSLDADFFVGNIHKWLFAPRGTAILWVHPKHHDVITPIVVSWNQDQKFQKKFIEQGTLDITNYLAVEAAIQYHKQLGGIAAIKSYNSTMASWASHILAMEWKTEVLPVPESMRAPYMACIRLPQEINIAYGATREGEGLARRDLFERYNISVVVTCIQSSLWCRISCHVYNCKTDYIKLADAVLRMKQLLMDGYEPSVARLGVASQLPSPALSYENISEGRHCANGLYV